MTGTRRLPFGVSILAVVAVLSAFVLPAAHVHESAAHRRVVHRHVVAHVAHPGDIEIDHGDHHDAPSLTASYVATRAFLIYPPVARGSVVACGHADGVVARVSPLDDPVAHAPPLHAPSLRGPPA